jgi:hypothetical protein
MIWFWRRQQAEMRLETRYDNTTNEFVVVVATDGGTVTERFADMKSFRTRLVALEQQLHADEWKNSGPPLFVPEGFPNTDRLRTRD